MNKDNMFDIDYIANNMPIEVAANEDGGKKRLLAAMFVSVREQTGMNRKEFADWLGIPYRTMQDWELATSQVPEYVLRLIAYKVMIEKERGNIK